MNTIGSYVFIDTSVFQEEGFFKPSGKVSKLFNLAENGKLNILMPEISLAGARHLLDLAVYKINRFAVFFFSGQIVEFKQGFPRIDIVDI